MNLSKYTSNELKDFLNLSKEEIEKEILNRNTNEYIGKYFIEIYGEENKNIEIGAPALSQVRQGQNFYGIMKEHRPSGGNNFEFEKELIYYDRSNQHYGHHRPTQSAGALRSDPLRLCRKP